jgi:hypothetical protein
MRSGQVAATPEGGPIDEGVPASAPGAGQVQVTPEAGPLTPPTLRDHMQGPILGLDDQPTASATTSNERQVPAMPPSPGSTGEGLGVREDTPTRTRQDDDELRKWPPYSGKPVSEVHWDALRYAAPVVSQAEKLAIRAIDVSGRGLSRLARYLETRRAERDAAETRKPEDDS